MNSSHPYYLGIDHTKCTCCGSLYPDKGRAFDGRRAYRCKSCGRTWTYGMQGRVPKYNPQSVGFQFANSGVVK